MECRPWSSTSRAPEALRVRGLTGVVESELYATAALESLVENRLADPDRIGIGGWSLGGYFAPRAAAFESRFKAALLGVPSSTMAGSSEDGQQMKN